MYQQIYDLILTGVFNGTVTPFQDEIIQVLSTLGAISIVVLPFAFTVCLIKNIMRF